MSDSFPIEQAELWLLRYRSLSIRRPVEIEAREVIQGLLDECARLRLALDDAQRDVVYHAECRPNRRQAEAAIADTKAMNDRWADEVAAHRATREALDACRQERDSFQQQVRDKLPILIHQKDAAEARVQALEAALKTEANREPKCVGWYRAMALRFAEDRQGLKQRTRKQAEQLASFSAALQQYGQHKNGCGVCSQCGVTPDRDGVVWHKKGCDEYPESLDQCTCGLAAALQALVSPQETTPASKS